MFLPAKMSFLIEGEMIGTAGSEDMATPGPSSTAEIWPRGGPASGGGGDGGSGGGDGGGASGGDPWPAAAA